MTAEQKGIVKSALGFVSGTAISRISGFFRDVSMAFFFGTDASIAAFLVALRFAILLRRIFGEGALLNGFVPHFEAQRKETPIQAAKFFRDTFFSLLFLLVLLIGAIVCSLYASLSQFSPENQEILRLTMLILPGTVFICLFGICSGLLHCEKHFFLTGVAPVAYNAIWIVAVWLLGGYAPKVAAVGLSLAISIAFFFQWFITFPKTLAFLRSHLSWKELFTFRLFSPEMRKMLSSISLGVLGVAAAQINTAVDALFSRYASLEGPAYLNYAIHLQQLPLALFGIGIASALLPPLSRAFQAGDLNQGKQLLEFSISQAMLIILPCTAAIFALGYASVNLIYGRGDFSIEAAVHTTRCLWGYGIGLFPMVLTLLLSPAFYARKDYWTPTACSLISIGVNFFLNLLFVYYLHFGPASLALTTSISAAINAALLFAALRPIRIFSRPFFMTTLCSLLAMGSALSLGAWLGDPTLLILQNQLPAVWTRDFSGQMLQFLSLLGVFSLTYLLLKKNEIVSLLGLNR